MYVSRKKVTKIIITPNKPFRDFKSFRPIKDDHPFTGNAWISKDGTRRVVLTRSMWRNWEIYTYVDVYIQDMHFRLHGEDVYHEWKAARPLPGYKNGWW